MSIVITLSVFLPLLCLGWYALGVSDARASEDERRAQQAVARLRRQYWRVAPIAEEAEIRRAS